MGTQGTINRKTVTDRRDLSFRTMQDIADDVARLGDDGDVLRTSANWSPAQILEHVTFFIDGALDGIEAAVPFHFKLLGKVFKKGALTKPIKAGFNMPKSMAGVATPAPNPRPSSTSGPRWPGSRAASECRSPAPCSGR